MTFAIKRVFHSVIRMSVTPHKLFQRPFTVCIEGNIGSAGTNLLELMYSDPTRYAFLFQSYVQLTMLQLHTYKTLSPYKIMERSVYSARCFIENMKRTEMLRPVEVVVLEDWYDWCIKSANIETDLIVYLRTTPETVYERMRERARKEENAVSLEYLKQIHQIHDDWLFHQTLFTVPAPVIMLDGNKSLEEMVGQFEICKNEIFGVHIEDENEKKSITALSPKNGLPQIKTGASN